MENLKIQIHESGNVKPNQTITIPLSKLEFGKQLLPTKAKILLEREGINLNSLGELTNKNIPKGSLIEIESGKEKIVIVVE